MSNPSTYWAQISLSNPPQMAIPFVDQDNASITINVNNFAFNQYGYSSSQNYTLNINTRGDFTGTDAISVYNQVDSYQANGSLQQVNGAYWNSSLVPGFTTSSSQGTGSVPVANLSGDFLGGFSSWGYSSNGLAAGNYSWQPLAGIYSFARGTTSGNVGGELHFVTKQNNGSMTDWITLDNAGNLKPTTTGNLGGANLGAPGNGWGKINLQYTIAAVSGNAIQNTPCGIVKASALTTTVTNSLVDANSVIIATMQTTDSNNVTIKTVFPIVGSFTITLSAAPLTACQIAWLVINTDN